jgi:CheY-like chemotaxis protein
MLQETNRLLIVEDQPLIAEMLEDMAVSLGWEVAAVAFTAQGALMAMESARPTLAVLDIDLGDSTSLGVAAVCYTLPIPVVFITEYGPDEIPAQCANAPILFKPVSEEAFESAVQDAVADHRRRAAVPFRTRVAQSRAP